MENSFLVQGIFELVTHLRIVLEGFCKPSWIVEPLAVLGVFQSWRNIEGREDEAECIATIKEESRRQERDCKVK